MQEIWKSINGYEGYYKVSNLGRVKSLEREIVRSDGVKYTIEEKLLSQIKSADGYISVKLSRSGKSKSFKVHSLVAAAFVDGYFDGAEVNHKDCCRHNNAANNLEWVTHRQNIQYSILMGNHVSKVANYTKENNPNYNNHKLHEIYKSNPNLSKEKQGRKGSKNGRSKSVTCVFENGSEKQFSYIGECADYLINSGLTRSKKTDSVRTAIRQSINKSQKYNGLRFKF